MAKTHPSWVTLYLPIGQKFQFNFDQNQANRLVNIPRKNIKRTKVFVFSNAIGTK